MPEQAEVPVELVMKHLLETTVMINASVNTLIMLGSEILARLTESDVDQVTHYWLQVKEQFYVSTVEALRDEIAESLK